MPPKNPTIDEWTALAQACNNPGVKVPDPVYEPITEPAPVLPPGNPDPIPLLPGYGGALEPQPVGPRPPIGGGWSGIPGRFVFPQLLLMFVPPGLEDMDFNDPLNPPRA